MKIINMNILNVTKGVICHQVNCSGVMGAGLALQVREKWPTIYQIFRSDFISGHASLGKVTVIRVDEELWVANMYAQKNYRPRGRCHTDYIAFETCLNKLSNWKFMSMGRKNAEIKFHFPFGIGCGLAGGNWTVISNLIAAKMPSAIICQWSAG